MPPKGRKEYNILSMERIYLDNNATTALSPKVLEAMLEELSGPASNPSSTHFFGQKARQKLLRARESIAQSLNCLTQEIVFTSGGTESMNMLIRSTAAHLPKGQILTSNIEHSCVDLTLRQLAHDGWEVVFLPPGEKGYIASEQIAEAITDRTRFIVLAAVNNETGIKCPVDAIASLAQSKGIPFIVDGVAWLGKEFFDLHPGITGIGFSAHKIHGPKGVGFIVDRHRTIPLIFGGPQEYGKRAGTENLAGILGAAVAVEEAIIRLPESRAHMLELQTLLETGLRDTCKVIINGTGERIGNTLNCSFPDADGETLLMQLDQKGIAVSHGSACSAGALEPSRVLTNMGLPYPRVRSSLRFSLSRYTTEVEIQRCVEALSSLHATCS